MKVGVYFGQTEVLFAVFVFDICIISYYISDVCGWWLVGMDIIDIGTVLADE